jgi:large subunit ribosomal protein L10
VPTQLTRAHRARAAALALVLHAAVLVARLEDVLIVDRRALRAENVQYEVVKNTLVRKAVVGTRLEGLAPHFKGNTAIAFHPEDPVAPARVITKFMKENPKLVLKAGWLDGRVLDASGVQALATLPGKQELRSRLLSVVIGVPTAFVRVLTAGPSAFVRVLEARRQQLGE